MSIATDTRFATLDPLMHSILRTTSIPGLAYAIIDSGQTVHVSTLGYRSLLHSARTTSRTLFPICSMTKSLFTCLLGMLVSQGHFAWNDTITTILPHFRLSDPGAAELTLEELLSHKSGLEGLPAWGSDNVPLHTLEDHQKVCEGLRVRSYQKGKFEYSNWGFEIAAAIIPYYCEGKTWGEVMRERILKPLGCTRTSVSGPQELDSWEDVTECFAAFAPAEGPEGAVRIASPMMSDHTTMGSSGGVWSCIEDLTVIWGALMRELTGTTTPDELRVFKEARLHELTALHTVLPSCDIGADQDKLQRSSYGMGFFRSVLPSQLLTVGPDYALLSEMVDPKDAAPIVGDLSGKSRLMVGHWGSSSGASVGTFIFPETRSVVITLMNGTRTAFASDYMMGALVEALFGKRMHRGTDWLDWTERTWDVAIRWGRKMEERVKTGLEVGRQSARKRKKKDNAALMGRYRHQDGLLTIDIKEDQDGKLRCLFQGKKEEDYELLHWHDDTFCWFPGMDTLLKRAQDSIRPLEYFLLTFTEGETGSVDALQWMYGPPEKLVLFREP